jgi:hypothetical protein
VIDRDQIELLVPQARYCGVSIFGDRNIESPASERSLSQPAKAFIVIDVQDPQRGDS